MLKATATKRWTLAEVHRLPDDGNKYELIDGELFVTPPPNDDHETIGARITRLIDPYVAAQGLGFVYHPRAVLRRRGSEVEPDLMVRRPHDKKTKKWETAPIPILVVEVHSPSTRRRDGMQKRDYYMRVGVAEYWMVDPEERTITSVRRGKDDVVVRDRITWSPPGAAESLTLDLTQVFG